jgi:hypothetical protein
MLHVDEPFSSILNNPFGFCAAIFQGFILTSLSVCVLVESGSQTGPPLAVHPKLAVSFNLFSPTYSF